ncbi:deaminase domain-containing protein [Pseudomonas sp. QTF5]|uniref:deaminase domain-containing protein n=1 Tax=Pseudomonas sp. QTF5 TaxID=1435425 RepID=UPI0004B28E1F|nr:deaminase domain-containing protein [Pseudomonas sp. QTF5]
MTSTALTAPDTAANAELRARQTLGLDDGPDIDALIPQPTARDRKQFKALVLTTPALAQSTTIDLYKAKGINAQIVDTVKNFMTGKSSLIRHLSGDVLRLASPEEVRATPSVFLLRILNSTETLDLAERLFKKLKWYGVLPGEQTPAAVRHQLVCKAICLYLQAPSADEPQELAGFRWQDPSNWGKSYQTLRSDFEQHLLHTRRVITTKEAILLAHVFQTRLSKDFAVRDIPSELRYKSSVVWVNFMHGVLLADELGLNRSQPLSFQQLVDLPLEHSVGASPEQLETIARLRLSPALEWAVCMGVVKSRTASDYDKEDIERAMTALESQNKSLSKAVMALDIPPPERMKMAKQLKDDLFGADTFESDGRRFLPEVRPSALGFKDMPTLKLSGHRFLDLYADGQFDDGQTWSITNSDGKTRTNQTFRIDDKRNYHAMGKDHHGVSRPIFFGRPLKLSGKTLPDINAQFETGFRNYLTTIRAAYQALIVSLLASLPLADRRALEQGAVQVLSLRSRDGRYGRSENKRARKGFVLKVTHQNEITYYELIPSAGVIRLRTGLRSSIIAGENVEFPLHASIPGQTYDPERNLSTSLLLDWTAHSKGNEPAKRASCIGFLDVVGHMPAVVLPDSTAIGGEVTALTSRLNTVAHYIASNFLYVDEQQLRDQARGMTQFDIMRAEGEQRRETFVAFVKGFVPFWGSIEDLMSGGTTNKILGGVGLLVDLASFLCPIGKFISGSVRLIRLAAGASRMAAKASLPSFSTLAGKLLTTSLRNLNPLDGIPSLLKTMGSGARNGLLAAGRISLGSIKKLTGQADSYRLVHNMPQAIDPGRWRPLANGDQLATINGVDDVLMRNTGPTGLKRFHLVDPVTSLPYGPRLHNNHRNLVQGRSTFKTLPPTESHVLAELPEHAHIREVLEVDGRTTLFVDDVPYRLDGNQLRRADLIDDQAMLRSLPCRVRRSPGADVCATKFVTRDPAPTPAIGSFDENKGWAPWFGDSIYTPATADRAMLLKTLKKKSRLPATVEFQKGIYGRIKVSLPYGNQNQFDTFQAGATIIPAIDDSKRYVFTRLDAGSFYVAELAQGQSIRDTLNFKKASTLPEDLKAELLTVYTGSLNANNVARIHGTEAVERALKTMQEIAIPIGGHVNPPDTLKLLKVDTSPGEAVLFDHSTRMIVTRLPDGAKNWSRSKEAPEVFRQRTIEIFDTLFLEPTIKPRNVDSALRIDSTMKKLQNLVPRSQRTRNPRNIAYAEVTTAGGMREVYVSVSGAQGTTGSLPLFKQNLGADHVKVGETTYFNIDLNQPHPGTSLNVTPEGKLLAVPHTIKDIDTYTPTLTSAPTSLDSESKLIGVIREKYPTPQSIKSVDVATTMPPCNSCSVVMKEFGFDGGENALNVLWH